MAQIGLIALLVLPAVGAAFVALLPRPADRTARAAGSVFAAAAFAVSVLLGVGAGHGSGYGARPAPIMPWHEIDVPWAPSLELRLHLGVDGLSYPLVVLTTLLTLLCCGYTLWRVPGGGSGRALVALLLVVEVGILGTFLALNLVLFFVCFEIVLLPMYAIIAGWGGADADAPPGGRRTPEPPRPLGMREPHRALGMREPHRAAARKFALYTLLGSVLLLVGVFLTVTAAGTADIVALTGRAGPPRTVQLASFVLFALAFAIKSPLWPLHTWLPDAHTRAPTVGSVILAGVLLKMGTYGLIRVGIGVAPQGARWAAPVLGLLAVAAIIVGCLVCLAQTELKRLIAYSSVGHMGFVLLGIATLSTVGIQAALIGNIAHGIITGLLFFLAGAIKDRTHTGSLAELGGLRESSPRLAGLLGFAAIASLGLPGLAGFWGEAFAVVGALHVGGPLWATLGVLAAFGGALTAAYFLRLLRHVSHGRPTAAVSVVTPGLAAVEIAVWAPLVLLAIAVGLLPSVVLGVAGAPVRDLVEAVGWVTG